MLRHYYVYILTNKSATLYIGVTNNLERRILQHRSGAEKGFASRYRMGKLVYFEVASDALEAIAREKQMKGLTRAKKMALINSVNAEWKDLSEGWFGQNNVGGGMRPDSSLRSE